MKTGSERLLREVYIQLIEAVGGPDVSDETMVPSIQAGWYRDQAKSISEVLLTETGQG